MITKIMPGLNNITKHPVRANLQKTTTLGLALLAGSSMSGWHGPHFEPTEMVIPGGLNFQEKAYYLLKGKLPQSVFERWTPKTDNYVSAQGDQVVTVNIGDGQYIGNIVEAPHDIGTVASTDNFIGAGQDISGDISEAIAGTASGIGTSSDDSDITAFEIWKHLAGMQ